MAGCVEKVLKILTAISEGENKPVTLASIAEKTGIAKSSCVRIISEMVEEGYVKQVSRTRGYILGPAVYCLTRYGKYDSEFVAVCHPVLRWLHKKTDLCVGLAVIQHGKVFIIDVINTEPKTVAQKGDIYPEDIYFTPAGRILLANMSEKELREIYTMYGNPAKGDRGQWDEVTSFETLKEQLAKIDARGVLAFEETRVEGREDRWGGWSTAIFRYSSCVGAIVISVTSKNGTMQRALEREQDIKKLMLQAHEAVVLTAKRIDLIRGI